MDTSFRNGRMLIPKNGLDSGLFMLVPNFNLADKIRELYLEAIARNE